MNDTKMIIPSYHTELVQDGQHQVQLNKFDLIGSCAQVLHELLDRSPVEKFVVLYIDFNNRITGSEVIAQGDLDMVQIGVRNMFRGAILHGAANVVLSHNHPYGDPTASVPDWMVTDAAMLVSELLKIKVLDHIIVSPNGQHYSCMEHVADFQRLMEQSAIRAQALDALTKIMPSINKGPMGVSLDTIKKIMGTF